MKLLEIHIHVHEGRPEPNEHELERLSSLSESLSQTAHKLALALNLPSAFSRIQENQNMPDLQAIVDDITAKWNDLKALVDQAESALAAVPQRIADAVAAAQAAGATPEQLQALTDLSAAMSTEAGELTSAIASQAPPVPDPNP